MLLAEHPLPGRQHLLGKRAGLRIFALAMELLDLLTEGCEFVRALRLRRRAGHRRNQDARKYPYQRSSQHGLSNNALNEFRHCALRS